MFGFLFEILALIGGIGLVVAMLFYYFYLFMDGLEDDVDTKADFLLAFIPFYLVAKSYYERYQRLK